MQFFGWPVIGRQIPPAVDRGSYKRFPGAEQSTSGLRSLSPKFDIESWRNSSS